MKFPGRSRRSSASLHTWLLSSLVAILLPVGYFAVSYSNMKAALETEAEINAGLISGIISANPELWRFETVRIHELLARRPHSWAAEARRVYDERNALVAESANPLLPPRVRVSRPVSDSGEAVGRIEISRSLWPILLPSAALALLGIGAGLLFKRWLPFRNLAEAVDRLEAANAFLNQVMEACANPILVLDLAGNIQMFNPAFQRMASRPGGTLLGLPFRSLFLPGTLPRVEAGLRNAGLEPPGDTAFEAVFLDAAGVEIQCSGAAAPLRHGGKTSGLVVSLVDLTERKRVEEMNRAMEQRFQQTQKLQSLGSLAGGIAHDMNNVLGAILGLATAHVEAHPAGSPTRIAFETIIKASERGGSMVKSLLRFARQSPGERRELDMNQVLQEGIHLLERNLPAGLGVERDFAPSLRPVQGDATALTHAFMNLFVNAMDAMPQGGTLTLRTRDEGDDWIRITVADTGFGMGKEILQQAMDPFFTTKEVGKGTGLGLSMVHSAVKAHRGHMEIQSEPGRGTRVIIRLPAGCPSPLPPLPPPQPPASVHRRPLNVLVVDDDEFVQLSSRMILEKLGHHSSSAATGEEALRQLEEGLHPDVVILDMNMPGLGGAETLPRLRALDPTVPVILATGRADQTALDLAEANAHVTLLPKPFSLNDLQRQFDPLY